MAQQTIDFTTLPKEVLSQIPFSLRTAGNVHYIKELPTGVQYLIKKYLEERTPAVSYENVYDTIPEISIYSDLTTITDAKKLILEYLKNYLLITLGSYPFDVQFGSYLKQQLHTKDISLRNALISNEISLVAGVVGLDYNIDVTVLSVSIGKTDGDLYTEYSTVIKVKIEDENFTIEIWL